MKHISFSLISIYSLNIAYKFYKANNHNLNELFNTCHFSLEDMQDEGSQIPVQSFLTSIHLIAKHLEDKQDLVFVLENHLELSDFGTYGFTLLAAPSLSQGLHFMIEGLSYMDSIFEVEWLDKDPETIEILIKNMGQFNELNSVLLDLAALTLHKYISYFVNDLNPNSLIYQKNHFSRDTPYSRGITIDKSILKLSSHLTHLAFFKNNARRILKEVSQFKKTQGCVFNVKRIIRNEIIKGDKPNLSRVSSMLGMTAKTLSRLLKSHNTSFQFCLDQVICDMALKLIEENHNTKEIAYSLGFQSIAGLNYLFIKKYGLTLHQLKTQLNLTGHHTKSSA